MKKIEKLSLKQIQTEMPMIPGSHLDGIKGGTELVFDQSEGRLRIYVDGEDISPSIAFLGSNDGIPIGVHNLMDTQDAYGTVFYGSGSEPIDPLHIGPEGLFRVDMIVPVEEQYGLEWKGIYESYCYSDTGNVSEAHGIVIQNSECMETINDAIYNYGELTTLTVQA